MNRLLTDALSFGGTLWGLAYAVYTILNLPERVPVHFGLNGQPDRFGNRLEAGFGLIALVAVTLGVNLLIVALSRHDPRARAQEPILNLTRVGVTALMLVLQLVIAASFQSQRFDARVVLIATGALLVVVGNLMPKLTPNPYAGVRLPYTFASDRAWRATNRAGGWLFVVLGALTALLSAVLPLNGILVAAATLILGLLGGLIWLWQVAKRSFETDPERRPFKAGER